MSLSSPRMRKLQCACVCVYVCVCACMCVSACVRVCYLARPSEYGSTRIRGCTVFVVSFEFIVNITKVIVSDNIFFVYC